MNQQAFFGEVETEAWRRFQHAFEARLDAIEASGRRLSQAEGYFLSEAVKAVVSHRYRLANYILDSADWQAAAQDVHAHASIAVEGLRSALEVLRVVVAVRGGRDPTTMIQ